MERLGRTGQRVMRCHREDETHPAKRLTLQARGVACVQHHAERQVRLPRGERFQGS